MEALYRGVIMAKTSKVVSFNSRKRKKDEARIALQKKFNAIIPTNNVIAYVNERDGGYVVTINFLRNDMQYEAEIPCLSITDKLMRNILMWAVADVQERMIEKHPDVQLP